MYSSNQCQCFLILFWYIHICLGLIVIETGLGFEITFDSVPEFNQYISMRVKFIVQTNDGDICGVRTQASHLSITSLTR